MHGMALNTPPLDSNEAYDTIYVAYLKCYCLLTHWPESLDTEYYIDYTLNTTLVL